ncbi:MULTISPECIES: hypothetical protein [unclassified Moorena]|uniref:hypothetical protein n=1 Tax=unclassified Moorena TaxID=2683338 RepID=UPI0014000F48|nr:MULTISPECIES: hypothetical protein [unclassified Moorena]NEO15585.1 hypothetical protein [Moorena sp. SIO3E8]NEQ00999.1 hypothetical protein [Moorena sp. SIO3F7]
MPKIIQNKSTLLLTMVVLVCSSALPINAIVKRPQSDQQLSQSQGQLVTLKWGDIWDILRRKKDEGGSRGNSTDDNLIEENDLIEQNLCMLTPGQLPDYDPNAEQNGSLEIWSEQPLFLWQGEMKGIEVRDYRTNQQLWEQPLEPTTTSIVYEGKPLQPGKAYFWRNTIPLEELPTKKSFRLMNDEKRNQITADLTALESNLKAQDASADQIALKRINYFINKQLWSDALREIYRMPNPPAEVTDLIDKINNNDFCPE